MGCKRYIYCFLISLILFNCKVDNSNKDVIHIDTVVRGNKQIIESYYFVFEEPVQVKDYTKDILRICDSLNNTVEKTFNDGIIISDIISKSKYPAQSAYCGILVNEILTKVGIKHDVYEYGRASSWFKNSEKILFVKGKWKTLDRNLKTGYVVGMSFDPNREVSHVGIYISNLNEWIIIKTFEGNTTKGGKQGIFYKERKAQILWIRKW